MNFYHYFQAKTSGNIYPLKCGTALIHTTEVKDYKKGCESFCRDGCKLYGIQGGCPPHSPRFSDLRKTYPAIWLWYAKFERKYLPPRLLNEINVWFRPVKMMDLVLSKFLYNVGMKMRDILNEDPSTRLLLHRFKPCRDCEGGVCGPRGGNVACGGGYMFLSNGHCEGCAGSGKCAWKEGKTHCKKPDRRVFSMESVGVRVDKVMEEVFDVQTHWFTRENRTPPYMVKTVALLLPFAPDFDVELRRMDERLVSVLENHTSYVKLTEKQQERALKGRYIVDRVKE